MENQENQLNEYQKFWYYLDSVFQQVDLDSGEKFKIIQLFVERKAGDLQLKTIEKLQENLEKVPVEGQKVQQNPAQKQQIMPKKAVEMPENDEFIEEVASQADGVPEEKPVEQPSKPIPRFNFRR